MLDFEGFLLIIDNSKFKKYLRLLKMKYKNQSIDFEVS